MLLVLLFVLFSHCLECNSPFALGEVSCIAKEREALLKFKQDLIDEYGIMSSWGSEEHKKECCKWKGIQCSNKTSHIISLRLSGELGLTPLRGKVSSALLELNHLKYLDLSYNDFGNDPIPEFIGSLEKLQYLNFMRSNFSGIVPDLGALISLKELHLGKNKLKALPKSIGQLSKLEILDVSFNSLEGTIYDVDLSELQNLKVLDLSFNPLGFNVMANWIPHFQLQVIRLASCKVGPHFPTWLQTQTNISKLDLSCAGISDEVPKWLWDLSPRMTYLNLSFNHISGAIPDLSSKFIGFPEIDVSYNNFSGHIPLLHPNSSILQLNNNMFMGSISSICTYGSLWILDLSNNQLSGKLPNCWENMTRLHMLILANNNFSGHIPHSLGSLWWLHALDLHNNSLSGELPFTFKNYRSLVMIDVHGNELTGKIPAWMGIHLKSLIVVSLGRNNFYGSIPIEICYLTEIQILDLSRNSISGNVPHCFNNYTSLLQKNRISDPITIDFGFNTDSSHEYSKYIDHALVEWKGQERVYTNTLGLLKLIDLSSNRLVGNIPREVSHLIALLSLNLSMNFLSGNIISNIGEMEMLECLDLSRNQFSGEIPASIAELNFLSVLDLSNNNLFGKIPSGTQLQGFSASVYAGNSELCGYPLMSCPSDGPNSSVIDSKNLENVEEEDDGLITLEFIIFMAFGFICGFWGVFGTLMINNSWTNACFNNFNMIRDWLYVRITIYATRLRGSLRANANN